MEQSAPPRLQSLDALRGACAGIVFLSHWHLWSGFTPVGTVERAVRSALDLVYELFVIGTWPVGGHHPAVLGFFVLSGFCIHFPFEWRLRHGDVSPPAWRGYFRRRFLRIMPVYWTACALGLLFVAIEQTHPSGSPLLALHASAPPWHVAARVLGVSGLYPDEIFAGNYILNTVAVELLMYAAYPLFFRFAARGAWRTLGAFFLFLHLCAIALLSWVTPFWVFNSILMLGLFWYAGALAAHLYVTRRWTVSGRALGLAWATFLLTKIIPHFYGLNLFKQAAWGVVCMFGIVWIVARETARPEPGRSWHHHWLRQLGAISYTLYAVHTPVVMLTTWTLLVGFDCHDYLVQLTAVLASSAVVTYAVYRGIELRFYRPRVTSSSPLVLPKPA